MRPIDFKERELIINCEKNLVVSASAGTGKTHITIQKITRDIEYHTNYQTFAAITFTRKAAKEIKDRLGLRSMSGFVGTNDIFIWQEIIQPFMYDAYGKDFKKEIRPDFTDENQIDNFVQGIERIRNNQLMCKYSDKKKNFAFQLALLILKKSDSARKYLCCKYFRIFIDEYQDSDIDMHKFFMYLCDTLKIPLFVVGDEKQSIYGWRGAYSDGFKSLFKKQDFVKFELSHNFRSNKQIQNYSNIFMDEVRKNVEFTKFNNEVVLFAYDNLNEASNFVKVWIQNDQNCATLSFSNINAQKWSDSFCNVGLNFMYIPSTPLDDSRLESEHIWIARAIANYFYKKKYSEYDFFDEIPMPELFEMKKIKKFLQAITLLDGEVVFNNLCKELYNYLSYSVENEQVDRELSALWEVLNNEKYIPTYNQDDYKFTSGTIHSSKGLEYNQVIINAGDYNFNNEGIKYLHYVAVSRPEERLLILAEKGYNYKRYLNYIKEAIDASNKIGIEIQIENILNLMPE